ncbi:MAG TPA: hypothetical protein PKX94_10050 [Opitutales bacterium]|nr:hypothetical protein [Opitutales bacterium]
MSPEDPSLDAAQASGQVHRNARIPSKADRFADRLRLEQERIGFDYLRAALERL